jgi:aerobic-type carbon monoxide dehydrogenase small subunit (CoxS/CutS family)
LNVNGIEYSVLIKPHWTLLDVLRDEIGLMGTKRGCDRGECGACTVIMNGEAILLFTQVPQGEVRVLTRNAIQEALHRVKNAGS